MTVASVSDGRSFSYDANGNMISRTAEGRSLNLAYDAENRLISILGEDIDYRYVYDGDGRRVLGVENGLVTVYVSSSFEVELEDIDVVPPPMPALPSPSITGDTTYTSTPTALTTTGVTWKSYYNGVGGTVEREAPHPCGVEYGDPEKIDTVFTLLQDHLSGTNIIVDGETSTHIRYGVWGEARDEVSQTPTSRLYTGQEKAVGLGLYYYNARWYDRYQARPVSPITDHW